MNSAASRARSKSASAKTTTGFLPPSSKCTRFKVGAPCAMMWLPVAVSPTKPTALMSGMLGQRLAGLLAEPMHAIHDARRQPRLA